MGTQFGPIPPDDRVLFCWNNGKLGEGRGERVNYWVNKNPIQFIHIIRRQQKNGDHRSGIFVFSKFFSFWKSIFISVCCSFCSRMGWFSWTLRWVSPWTTSKYDQKLIFKKCNKNLGLIDNFVTNPELFRYRSSKWKKGNYILETEWLEEMGKGRGTGNEAKKCASDKLFRR